MGNGCIKLNLHFSKGSKGGMGWVEQNIKSYTCHLKGLLWNWTNVNNIFLDFS
jgi:hypothetical protein